jgi:hypothetical protein
MPALAAQSGKPDPFHTRIPGDTMRLLVFAACLLATSSAFADGVGIGIGRLPLLRPFQNQQPGPYETTTFDLGVDVTDVPLTPQGVRSFMATLTPEGQYIIQNTCRNYLGDPSQVRSSMTLPFCRVVVGG